MAEQDQKFIEGVVKMLVNNPKKVKVDRLVNEKGVLLTIDVDPEDIASLVGKQGRNITALRHLARLIGMKNKSFISVRLNQPEK